MISEISSSVSLDVGVIYNAELDTTSVELCEEAPSPPSTPKYPSHSLQTSMIAQMAEEAFILKTLKDAVGDEDINLFKQCFYKEILKEGKARTLLTWNMATLYQDAISSCTLPFLQSLEGFFYSLKPPEIKLFSEKNYLEVLLCKLSVPEKRGFSPHQLTAVLNRHAFSNSFAESIWNSSWQKAFQNEDIEGLKILKEHPLFDLMERRLERTLHLIDNEFVEKYLPEHSEKEYWEWKSKIYDALDIHAIEDIKEFDKVQNALDKKKQLKMLSVFSLLPCINVSLSKQLTTQKRTDLVADFFLARGASLSHKSYEKIVSHLSSTDIDCEILSKRLIKEVFVNSYDTYTDETRNDLCPDLTHQTDDFKSLLDDMEGVKDIEGIEDVDEEERIWDLKSTWYDSYYRTVLLSLLCRNVGCYLLMQNEKIQELISKIDEGPAFLEKMESFYTELTAILPKDTVIAEYDGIPYEKAASAIKLYLKFHS